MTSAGNGWNVADTASSLALRVSQSGLLLGGKPPSRISLLSRSQLRPQGHATGEKSRFNVHVVGRSRNSVSSEISVSGSAAYTKAGL